jgi:hypothetical protein
VILCYGLKRFIVLRGLPFIVPARIILVASVLLQNGWQGGFSEK